MIAVDGLECSQFHPPSEQLWGRRANESAHVSAGQTKTTQAQVQQHWRRQPKMVPCTAVIAGPGSRITLAASVTRARKNERGLVWRNLQQTLIRGTRVLHAVHVVDLSLGSGPFLETRLINSVA